VSEARTDSRSRAQKNHSEILRAMRTTTQAKVAEMTGMSETAISRMKDNMLPDLSMLLAVIGLKVVPESQRTYSTDYIAALKTLAVESLSNDGPASGFGEME
jgi:transcriptional regulator with XRE-family HTH domain